MNQRIVKLYDGENLTNQIISENLPKDLITNGKINFIGFISNSNYFIYSLPKNYIQTYPENDINLLYSVLMKYNKSLSSKKDNNNKQFPLLEYEKIYDYYKKYGIYKTRNKTYNTKYEGKINWHKTYSNNKICLNNSNIIYIPPVYKKNNTKYTTLSKIMDYILFDGYSIFFHKISKFPCYKPLFNDFKHITNIDNIIKILIMEYNKENKDINKLLIVACINYLKWKSNLLRNDKIKIIVKNVNLLWQEMVNNFLKIKFNCQTYNIKSKNPNQLIFTNSINQKWIQEKTININSLSNSHNIRIDHFSVFNNIVYIFDSKYYLDDLNLNYKQIAYYYLLKDQLANQEVISALIKPTNQYKKINVKTHINRYFIDGLVIFEVLINMNWMMSSYLNNFI